MMKFFTFLSFIIILYSGCTLSDINKAPQKIDYPHYDIQLIIDQLGKAAMPEQAALFYRIWTRKTLIEWAKITELCIRYFITKDLFYYMSWKKILDMKSL
ncbi:MAG: hypothetical protein K0B08_07310 [Bacteroidales bacterium]|nr:hypothetical protein [Bacteroidales bacterium]